MIFATSEPPQYMVVSPTDRELKDRFVYRNKYLTIKTSIQTAFLEKCEYLLSAINPNHPNLLDIISISQLDSFGKMILLTELN